MISDFAERFMFVIAMCWSLYVISYVTISILFGA